LPVVLLVAANAALYTMFMAADVFGDGIFASAIPAGRLKYASVCVCFAISALVLLGAPRRRDAPTYAVPCRRDAVLQAIVFAFTLPADFLILFTPHITEGIIVFCCAHMAALVRYAGAKRGMRISVGACVILAGSAVALFAGKPAMFGDAAIFSLDNELYAELIASIAYAILITSVTIAAFRKRQARAAGILSRLGMALFMLCDVCVLLWNLRMGVGVTAIPGWTVTLIWAFYLPGQTMLALSAIGKR
jgi:hypothetical protein